MERQTSRMRSYRSKFGLSLPVRRRLSVRDCCKRAHLPLLVNKNATNALNAAIAAANDSYIADDSITVYVAEARSENA